MPTYRDDLHLGHKVPLVETDDLGNGAITTEKIADEAITPEKLSPSVVPTVIKPLIDALEQKHDEDVNRLDTKDTDLQNQIDSLQIHGLAVSNIFGDDPHIGISQKKLSWFANYVLSLLEEALDRPLLGFTWLVTPTYIHGEWPTRVSISAQPTSEGNVFEHIKLFANNVVVDEVTDVVSSYSFEIDLQQTVNLRMEAKLLGTYYERTETVNHYSSFWLGAGSTYASIMDQAHQVPLDGGSRVVKDITASDGDNIFIIIGDSVSSAFIRADMNGVEIPFTMETVTIDGHQYNIYTSQETYEEGTYSIDING